MDKKDGARVKFGQSNLSIDISYEKVDMHMITACEGNCTARFCQRISSFIMNLCKKQKWQVEACKGALDWRSLVSDVLTAERRSQGPRPAIYSSDFGITGSLSTFLKVLKELILGGQVITKTKYKS